MRKKAGVKASLPWLVRAPNFCQKSSVTSPETIRTFVTNFVGLAFQGGANRFEEISLARTSTTHILKLAVISPFALAIAAASLNAHPLAAPGVTSLTEPKVTFTVPDRHYALLKRGQVTAIIVDNHDVDVPELPGHRAGYSGIASWKRGEHPPNLFVPAYAGLNFEHIHDGTTKVNAEKFEPRRAPMELRVVNEFTVELYQGPTPNWKLESCGRYQLLPDGAIEYTFECIPRAATFQRGYIGLFWASYIAAPEDGAIHFRGRGTSALGRGTWLRTVSPTHGVDSTHPPAGALPFVPVDPGFPLTLVNHRSRYVYTEPWFYGVSHGLVYAQMFRQKDQIWFAQSPTGGGDNNPAWDFQWFIPDWRVDEVYGFVMRVALLSWQDATSLEEQTRPHRTALNPP
jgi:hypothetical protein